MRFKALAILILMAGFRCSGSTVESTLRSILDSKTDAALPKPNLFFSEVNENTVQDLTATELQELVTLVAQCLQSPRLEVRRYGLITATALSFRPDSSALLEPIIDDIERIADAPGSGLRHGALYVLGSTNPHPSPKAVSYLARHLEETGNSPQELRTVAVSLIQASAGNPALRRKVLAIVQSQSDPGVKIGVLAELRSEKADDADSQSFVQRGLDNPNPYVRGAAIDTVANFSPDIRTSFADRLRQIQADTNESPENRSKAKAVLSIG